MHDETEFACAIIYRKGRRRFFKRDLINYRVQPYLPKDVRLWLKDVHEMVLIKARLTGWSGPE